MNDPKHKAIKLLKSAVPQLLIAADVCLCPYADTGHCGVFDKDGHMINQESIDRLGEIALSYAKAGADVIAPSVGVIIFTTFLIVKIDFK